MQKLINIFLLCLMVFGSCAFAETHAINNDRNEAINDGAVLLEVANRRVVTLRDTLLGETPKIRVERAGSVINEVLNTETDIKVTTAPIQGSYLVLFGEKRAFILSPKDLAGHEDSVQQVAEDAAETLRLIVTETLEARNMKFLAIAVGYSLLATTFYVLLVCGTLFIRKKLVIFLLRLTNLHAEKFQIRGTHLLDIGNVYPVLSRLISFFCWLLVLLLSYEWLSFVLQLFPYTRPWGESLNGYLLDLVSYLMRGMVSAIPGLVVALCIFLIARGLSGFISSLLRRLAYQGSIGWLSRETLQPSMRLVSLAIWLFALAMAYPYLPGADTEAFKGLTVLLGLMLSLGASSVVGQGAAGLILTYTRTLRVGEFVSIGEYEGTVVALGMFTTTIRTGLGEMLTIPNTIITGTITKNYSRVVQGDGYVVDTTVTIGYDTSWRQVEAMLLEAARRTSGIQAIPAPQVFQTALTDFYPEYRLVAHAIPREPKPRAELLTMLHANIQDVFNEYGVQIMSPHYMGDPAQAKWVPKEKWAVPPVAADKP